MKQVISIILAVAVGVGVAYAVFRIGGFGVPASVRAAQHLTSPDEGVRTKAIEKWSEPASPASTPRLFTDFDVMDALKAELPATGDDVLRDLADHFGEAPQWIDQFPDAQERYLLILAREPDQASGATVLRQIKRFDPESELGRIADVLDALSDHPDPAIRVSAIEHAAHYLGRNEEPIVTKHLDDPDQGVQRLAWIHLALIDPASGHTGRWRDAPNPVAQAMLLSTAFTNPQQMQSILEEAVGDRAVRAKLGDTPFLLNHIAQGNLLEKFFLRSESDDQLKSLFDDAQRAHALLTGRHAELLTIPGEQAEPAS